MTNKYRKKPVVIEAKQFTALTIEQGEELASWCGGKLCGTALRPEDRVIKIDTLEGEMEASHGDWIIRGVKGEFYPCKPDVFAITYELALNAQPEAQAGGEVVCAVCEEVVEKVEAGYVPRGHGVYSKPFTAPPPSAEPPYEIDALFDALSNLEHDNYERSYSGSKNREADAGLIRAALERYVALVAAQHQEARND